MKKEAMRDIIKKPVPDVFSASVNKKTMKRTMSYAEFMEKIVDRSGKRIERIKKEVEALGEFLFDFIEDYGVSDTTVRLNIDYETFKKLDDYATVKELTVEEFIKKFVEANDLSQIELS